MKKLILLLFTLTLFVSCFSQSPFKRMPRPNKTFSAINGVTTTEITAYRFTAPTATFLYPQRQIGTSLGFGYNRMHFVDSTQRYYTDFALNLAIIAAGNTVPNANNFMSLGIFACFFNSLIQVGPVYTLPNGANPKGTFGVGLNLGIPLN